MSFLGKTLINISGTFGLGIINLILGILLSRWLDPAGVGQYQLAISTATMGAAFLTLGVGGATIYFINNQKHGKAEVATLSMKFGLTIGVVVFVLLCCLYSYEAYFGHINWEAKICIGIYGGLYAMVTVCWPLLMADLHVGKYVTVQITPRLVFLLLLLVIIICGKVSVEVAWWLTAIGQVFGITVLIWFLRNDFSKNKPFNFGLLKSMVSYGIKMNISYIILLLNGEVGIFMVRFFSTDDFAEIGYYSRAIRLGNMLLLISGALSPLLLSKWSSVEIGDRQTQVERVSRVFVTLLFVVIIFSEFLAYYLVLGLYGNKFLPAVPMMRIVFIGIAARFLMTPFSQLFSSSGQPLLTGLVYGINLATMTVLMFFWVPAHQGIGASWAFTVGNYGGLIAGALIGHKTFGVRLSKSLLITKDDIDYLRNAITRRN